MIDIELIVHSTADTILIKYLDDGDDDEDDDHRTKHNIQEQTIF